MPEFTGEQPLCEFEWTFMNLNENIANLAAKTYMSFIQNVFSDTS